MSIRTEVAIIGAGQAGLAVSYELTQRGVDHLVLEREEIGETWRSQRWDSFHLNTPNWANSLTGMEFHPGAPNAFVRCEGLIQYLEAYAASFELPIRTNTAVTELTGLADGSYALRTEGEEFLARAVVVAAGGLTRPNVPRVAQQLGPGVESFSAATYRNPGALPDGAVLVVGSAQSGCQIAEDLLEAGRRVYLSASKVARVPRVYRGRDTMAWFRDLGVFDARVDQLKDPTLVFASQPQVSGTHGGHTVSLQSLARNGATLLGRVADVDGHIVRLDASLLACIEFADQKSDGFKADVDAYIARTGIEIEDAQDDPGEPALPDLGGSEAVRAVDLKRSGIGSIIWCTGFRADWSWIHLEVFGDRGEPRHVAGVTESPGLCFVGLPWLTKRKSGILYGVSEDAAAIVGPVTRHLLREAA